MYKVYTALKKEIPIKTNIIDFDQFNKPFKSPISPNKFNEGGAAIFLEHSKNHHKATLGKKFNMPLLIINLRLFIRS